jgi:hypothetical protein
MARKPKLPDFDTPAWGDIVEHLLAICREGDGIMRTDVYTCLQIAELVHRARQGCSDAGHEVAPLLELITGWLTERTGCFVCGNAIRSPGGVAIIQALNVNVEHAMGGIVCARCIALNTDRLRANIVEVLRTVGIKPGPGARNVHLDGGRA